MAIETERKFLLKNSSWRQGAEGAAYCQGYLSVEPERTVRVRITGKRGTLTIKGKSHGASRAEYEFGIPLADARKILDELCLRPLIEKTRYRISFAGLVWEVDEFVGKNHGLILAEVELEDENQLLELPDWVGEEVTGDHRYYGANLVKAPFSVW